MTGCKGTGVGVRVSERQLKTKTNLTSSFPFPIQQLHQLHFVKNEGAVLIFFKERWHNSIIFGLCSLQIVVDHLPVQFVLMVNIFVWLQIQVKYRDWKCESWLRRQNNRPLFWTASQKRTTSKSCKANLISYFLPPPKKNKKLASVHSYCSTAMIEKTTRYLIRGQTNFSWCCLFQSFLS